MNLRAARAVAFLLTVVASLTPASPTVAQLVTPRTVPVLQDEQFELYPSSRPGLAGVSIALDDTLADPFSNPAKAMRLRGFTLMTAPFSHSITENRGGGRTLPIGISGVSGGWGVAALVAIQELDRPDNGWNRPTSEKTSNNQYLTAAIAHTIAPGLAIGASAFHADLAAVDGVDLLYAGSDHIDQSGSLTDLRVGLTREWEPGHVFELLALRNVTDMRHDVHFSTWMYDPVARTSTMNQRSDVNLDQTNIWGVHSEYTHPVGVEGWSIGALVTANRLEHPGIPNYVLQNIPRDPGTTDAFNVGVGAARPTGAFTVGVDVILEPMTSDTWADAATNTTRADGSVIPAGGKTVENHFRFRNSKARMGVGRTWSTSDSSGGAITVDFGLAFYAISYDLQQTNNITRLARTQHENWVESGPTFGLRYRSRDIEVSYAFRANCGTQGCNFTPQENIILAADAVSTGGIIAAPSSPLFLRGGSETSHHFMVAIPIR